jgi:hypothetical protein
MMTEDLLEQQTVPVGLSSTASQTPLLVASEESNGVARNDPAMDQASRREEDALTAAANVTVGMAPRERQKVYILEFSKTPASLDEALLDSQQLEECTQKHELLQRGFCGVDGDPRKLPSKARVFVPLDLYTPVLAALEVEQYSRLNYKHVIVAESYLTIVERIVAGLRHPSVRESRSKRTQLVIDGAWSL